MNCISSKHELQKLALPEDAEGPRVSIVIVSYNSQDFLPDCIGALNLDTHPFEAIIVDNCSVDGTYSVLRRLDAPGNSLHVVLNGQNVGFGKASNRGAALSRGKYFLFLNPDAVADAEVVARMASYLDNNPDVGVLGPKVIRADGSLQLSCGRAPTLYYRLFEALRLPQLSAKLFGGSRYCAWNHSESRDVGWVSGCCLMIRPAVFHNVGGFDENFFLFEEDTDLCLRVLETGHRVVYWPEAVVYHAEGESAKAVRPFALLTFYRSKLHFSRKYGRSFEYAVLRCLFPLISLAKSIAARVLAQAKGIPAYKEAAQVHMQVATALLLNRDLYPYTNDAAPTAVQHNPE